MFMDLHFAYLRYHSRINDLFDYGSYIHLAHLILFWAQSLYQSAIPLILLSSVYW